MQSLINHTPLFMIQFENTKLWATPPVISGLPNKILGLNQEDKYSFWQKTLTAFRKTD